MASGGKMEVETPMANTQTWKKRKFSTAFTKPVAKNGKIDPDALNKKLAAMQKQMKTLSKDQAEIRYKDVVATTQTVSTSGAFSLLNGMTTGDIDGTHEGSASNMKSVQETIAFTVADASNIIRRIILWDKEPKGAAPTLAEVLQDAVTQPTYSPRNWINRDRFQFLKDDLFILNTTNSVVSSKLYLKMKGKKTIYATSAIDITGIASGALYALLVSDSNVSTHPGYNAYWRVVYNA